MIQSDVPIRTAQIKSYSNKTTAAKQLVRGGGSGNCWLLSYVVIGINSIN